MGFIVSGGCQKTPGTCHLSFGLKETPTLTGDDDIGCVRVSIGWLTTENDVSDFVSFMHEGFSEKPSEEPMDHHENL